MILSKMYEKRKKEKQRKLKMQTAKKVLLGTVAGSLSGLLGGLLFSPKSGKETREDIATTSKDITDNIKNKTAELKETIDTKVCDAKVTITDAKAKISEYLNDKKIAKTNCDAVEVLIDKEELIPTLEQTAKEKANKTSKE